MKRTVVENTDGLFDRLPRRDIDLSTPFRGQKKRDYGCFYEITPDAQIPLVSGVTSLSNVQEGIRSFDES